MIYDEGSKNVDNLGLASDVIPETKAIEPHKNKFDINKVILEAREEERRKIARDLHDGPAQSLAAILLDLSILVAELPATEELEKLKKQLTKLQDIAKDSLNEIRQILYDLKPVQLNSSLKSALQDYFDQMNIKFGLETEFQTAGVPQNYPTYVQIAIFRLVQEALNNIVKHASVKKACVFLYESEEKITLTIKDEGNGFNKEKELSKSGSYGIVGMRERTVLLGGTFDIISKPGSGTQILIEIPRKGRHYIGESKGNDSR
ncbi:MAG: sensor histidine kinase [Syntrophomonadaceae bacterium]|jgi:two-component system sensor histidine kinase DegS|nr:sensor histidine kinase [Syntrophomonadaceae bacterium]